MKSVPPAWQARAQTGAFSRRDAAILFADLRGFASLGAAYPPEVVAGLLNRCFVRMSETVVRHHGAIDKFMGDALMAVFPSRQQAPGAHIRAALACAVDMQIAMSEQNAAKEQGQPDLYMGIGINSGEVMAGWIGSEHYSAFTVLGDEVNLASRLEAFSLRGQILVSEAVYRSSRDFVVSGAPMEVYVKGRPVRVQVHEVQAIPTLQKAVPRQEIRRSLRVMARLPFSYQLLASKIVVPERREGAILDIGYYGARVELNRPVALHAELKLDVDLPLVGHRASDIYAKVVKVSENAGRCLAGVEFSSLGPLSHTKIRLLVQMLIQGSEAG